MDCTNCSAVTRRECDAYRGSMEQINEFACRRIEKLEELSATQGDVLNRLVTLQETQAKAQPGDKSKVAAFFDTKAGVVLIIGIVGVVLLLVMEQINTTATEKIIEKLPEIISGTL